MTTETTRSILVTGSSRGIGRAIAERLAASGFQVVVHCRGNLAAAGEVCNAITASGGLRPRVLQFDIADRAACAAAITADMDAHGAYYGIVCNAGLARDGDDSRGVKVALGRGRRADQVGGVGVGDMRRGAIGLAIDRDGAQPQLFARTHHAQSDLAAIGDQDSVEHMPRDA